MHIRAFFSIELPLSVKELINEQLVKKLQSHFHQRAIRWTRQENLHITLQFLEEVDAFDVEKLIKNVRNELKSALSFFLELGELELFPTACKPRIISLSVGPEEILAQLAKKIGSGILQTHYPIETRPFRGHLTLGRIKETHPTNISLNNIKLPLFDKTQIKEVILFRSEPSKESSRYTEMARFILS